MKAADNETNLNSPEEAAAEATDLRTKYEAMKLENERLSRAEGRVRVLTEALTRIKASMEVLPWSHRNPREDAYIKVIIAALSTPAPEQPAQPSAGKATPLTVQAQDGAVLIEDHDRNLSVLALTTPLHITCPFDGQQWDVRTQEQADLFQKHLGWHAAEVATLKAREATTIATVNAAWADTVAAITAERDALAATVKRLNGILAGNTRAETLNNLSAVAEGRINDRSLRILADEIFLASRTTPPKEGQGK